MGYLMAWGKLIHEKNRTFWKSPGTVPLNIRTAKPEREIGGGKRTCYHDLLSLLFRISSWQRLSQENQRRHLKRSSQLCWFPAWNWWLGQRLSPRCCSTCIRDAFSQNSWIKSGNQWLFNDSIDSQANEPWLWPCLKGQYSVRWRILRLRWNTFCVLSESP